MERKVDSYGRSATSLHPLVKPQAPCPLAPIRLVRMVRKVDGYSRSATSFRSLGKPQAPCPLAPIRLVRMERKVDSYGRSHAPRSARAGGLGRYPTFCDKTSCVS